MIPLLASPLVLLSITLPILENDLLYLYSLIPFYNCLTRAVSIAHTYKVFFWFLLRSLFSRANLITTTTPARQHLSCAYAPQSHTFLLMETSIDFFISKTIHTLAGTPTLSYSIVPLPDSFGISRCAVCSLTNLLIRYESQSQGFAKICFLFYLHIYYIIFFYKNQLKFFIFKLFN